MDLILLLLAFFRFALSRPPKGTAVGRRGVIFDAIRPRGLYLIGKAGSGKTTALLNLMYRDIVRRRGIAFIDPHGDASLELLKLIPKDRAKDTIYFEPARHPIPLNLMRADNEFEMEVMASDIITTFQRLSDTSGPRMSGILRYTVAALVEYQKASFLDIHAFLTNEKFRKGVLHAISDQEVIRFFTEDFPRMPDNAADPIIYRLSQVMLSPTLCRVLGNPDATFDFYTEMNRKHILVFNLSGLGGNSAFVGSLLVSQFQLAAMRRARIPEKFRVPFYLYVDEFQNFTSEAFETVLSEARKYKLCLTIAHQFASQIPERMRKAILGNVAAALMFQCDIGDASHFKGMLRQFTPEDLVEQDVGQAILYLPKVTRKIKTFRPPHARQSFITDILANTARYIPAQAKALPAPASTQPETKPKGRRRK